MRKRFFYWSPLVFIMNALLIGYGAFIGKGPGAFCVWTGIAILALSADVE